MKKLFALLFAVTSVFTCNVSQAYTATALAAGDYHTCLLTNNGSVKCWGQNLYGQLGNGMTLDRSVPGNVTGLSGVMAIAAGGSHTCALTNAGGVECWGANQFGQLGNGTVQNTNPAGTPTPVNVTGLSGGVTAIAVGSNYTCALTSAGGVECWGAIGESPHSTPLPVAGLGSGVAGIAAGAYHACVVTDAGGVECWGDNGHGELGNGVTTYSATPVNVTGLSTGVTAVAAGGAHTCVLTVGGGVQCWGFNGEGQLGNGTKTDSLIPVNVKGLSSGVTAIVAGESNTCALTSAGGVKCWGGESIQTSSPRGVTGLSSGVMAIVSSGGHDCALTSTGFVKCWGYNGFGELGDGGTISTPSPVNLLGYMKNDFDGDGQTDILLLNTTTGRTQYWKDADKAQRVYPGAYDTDFSYQGSGDFDGDGRSDLFFTKSSNHATLIWSGAVKSTATYPGTGTAGFNVATICDVNGDGRDDVIWFNPSNGKTQIWSGASKASVTYPGTQAAGFAVAACADFDADGKADIFWHNSTSGANQIWLGANKSTKLYPGISSDLTLTPVGAAEVEGHAFMAWYQSSSGSLIYWKDGLKNHEITGFYGSAITASFVPVAVGDFSGKYGIADWLWINSTTKETLVSSAWLSATVMTYPGTVPAGFSIQK